MSVNLKGYYGDPAAVTKACDYVDERMVAAGIGVNFADGEPPTGVIDGNNATFTLRNSPNPPSSLALFKNGIKMRAGEDFNLSGSTFTYVPAQVPNVIPKRKAYLIVVIGAALGICTAAVTQIDLTSQVKGILPIGNGGTGSAALSTGVVRSASGTLSGAELSGDAQAAAMRWPEQMRQLQRRRLERSLQPVLAAQQL